MMDITKIFDTVIITMFIVAFCDHNEIIIIDYLIPRFSVWRLAVKVRRLDSGRYVIHCIFARFVKQIVITIAVWTVGNGSG